MIALTVLVYQDTKEPFVKRILMNATRVHAKMEHFAQIPSIVTLVCAHLGLKEKTVTLLFQTFAQITRVPMEEHVLDQE